MKSREIRFKRMAEEGIESEERRVDILIIDTVRGCLSFRLG